MLVPLKISGISALRNKLGEFALKIFYFSNLDQQEEKIYAYIRYKVYLVDKLKANMLIGNNVLGMEGFFINLSIFLTYIRSCSIDIYISAKFLFCLFTHKVLANIIIIVFSKFKALVVFKQILLPDSRDFFFYLVLQPKLTFYAHLIDYIICRILVGNDANYYIQVPKNYNLSYITNLVYKNCFAVKIEVDAVVYLPLVSLLFHEQNGIIIPPADNNIKTKLLNNIKIYKDNNVVQQITQLFNKYPSIQKFLKFVHIFLERQIKVLLKPSWKLRVTSIKP